MTVEEAKRYCLSLSDTCLCTPFDETTEVIKHCSNGKMFALFSSPDERESINLKCEPMEADFLRSAYQGVIPGHHSLNKQYSNAFYSYDIPE